MPCERSASTAWSVHEPLAFPLNHCWNHGQCLKLCLQDINGDGYLSFEELRQGLGDASLGSEQCGNIVQAVMNALDVSGNGSIDYHEFLAAVVDRQQTLTDQTLAEMFGAPSTHTFPTAVCISCNAVHMQACKQKFLSQRKQGVLSETLHTRCKLL